MKLRDGEVRFEVLTAVRMPVFGLLHRADFKVHIKVSEEYIANFFRAQGYNL
jgi:hypothetical protein